MLYQPHSHRRIIVLLLLGIVVLTLSACQSVASVPESAPIADATPTLSANIAAIDPMPMDQTLPPVHLQIPAIGLDVPVTPMGWKVALLDGERTTLWDEPLNEAGWHINSAGAGAVGNTIISGLQAEGAAVFAPLALGAVQPGQEVLLTDSDGLTFVYRVTEVTEPIPVAGATESEMAQATSFYEPVDEARLTLVTGWPEFTTTHRVFALADFVGLVK